MGKRKSYITRYHELCNKARDEFKTEMIKRGITRFEFTRYEVPFATEDGYEYVEYVEIDENGCLIYDTYEKKSIYGQRGMWIEAYTAFLHKTNTFSKIFAY